MTKKDDRWRDNWEEIRIDNVIKDKRDQIVISRRVFDDVTHWRGTNQFGPDGILGLTKYPLVLKGF